MYEWGKRRGLLLRRRPLEGPGVLQEVVLRLERRLERPRPHGLRPDFILDRLSDILNQLLDERCFSQVQFISVGLAFSMIAGEGGRGLRVTSLGFAVGRHPRHDGRILLSRRSSSRALKDDSGIRSFSLTC